jgi:endonuclease/exonuclease/phosphatase family metal-dependent hydrolase
MRHFAKRVSLVAGRGVVMLTTALVAAMYPQPAAAQGDIVLQASSAAKRAGRWTVARDASSTSGSVIRHGDRGGKKKTRPSASPADYFELTFKAQANTPYRLWLLGRADGDSWANDSVFVQFDRSVTSSGSSTYRIGTTSATEINLESCRGCGISGWTWQDNGYGSGTLGPTIRFNRTGTQTLRVQTREDGMAVDRIVLSPSTYMKRAPGGAAAPAPTPSSGGSSSGGDDEDDKASAPPSTSAKVLKVLDWNIHHGVGTDGRYDIDRIAAAIARTGANVVSLNEVERYTGWGNEDQPARFAALLRARTGKTWRYNFAQNSGNAKGQGNLILTTYDIESDDDHELSHTRAVARITILVNGIRVNLYSTHLDAESSSRRATQMRELTSWADNYPEQRILTGDFNAWPGASEIAIMTKGHTDAWASAKKSGDDVSYSGNAAGNTRNSRIDYVFYSKGASRLKLKETRVFDMRDSKGVMPSDHRPIMATFDVK